MVSALCSKLSAWGRRETLKIVARLFLKLKVLFRRDVSRSRRAIMSLLVEVRRPRPRAKVPAITGSARKGFVAEIGAADRSRAVGGAG